MPTPRLDTNKIAEARLAQYQIRFQGPNGANAVVWDIDRIDDMDAMNSAMEVCRNQKAEVWDGDRKVANILLSVEPRLTL
jgi:hypothetical protein